MRFNSSHLINTIFSFSYGYISSMYPRELIVVTLNVCKSNPSYDHKFVFLRIIFSNISKYIIQQEKQPLISIWNISKWLLVAVITRGKIPFGIPRTFCYLEIRALVYLRVLAKVLLSFLWKIINFVISLFIIHFDEMFAQGYPSNGCMQCVVVFPYSLHFLHDQHIHCQSRHQPP